MHNLKSVSMASKSVPTFLLCMIGMAMMAYVTAACQLDVCKSRSICPRPNTEDPRLFVEVSCPLFLELLLIEL